MISLHLIIKIIYINVLPCAVRTESVVLSCNFIVVLMLPQDTNAKKYISVLGTATGRGATIFSGAIPMARDNIRIY